VLDGRGGGVIAYCYQPVAGANTKKEIHAINADGSGDIGIINTDVGLNHHNWSPDAQKFAAVGYASETTWSIYVFDADGSNFARLTSTDDVWDNDPAWSPDGTQIAFTRIYPDQNNREEIWLMNSDGSDQHWIGVQGGSAKWLPDGARLIYHAQKSPDDSYDIYTCNTDGTDEERLTSTPSGEITPVYSPDGSQIALTVVGDDLSHGIYVMDADGTNVRRLTEGGAPKWSPDGSLIAFHSGPFEEWEVYIINSDGTNLRQVTNSPTGITAINPVWWPATATSKPTSTPTPTSSPLDDVGAGMIAFVSDRGGDDEIYLMPLPGAQDSELTLYQLTNNEEDDALPDWSPDGTQMAFASTRDGNWEIYVMDVAHDPQGEGADGANLRRLTNHEGDDTLPVWSPDGSQIAFSSKRDGDWEIYVMDADGKDLRRLTHNPDIDMKPSWSPDGSQIVFDSGAGYNRQIFVMDADGSNQRQIARADGGWPAWSPDGTQIAYFGRLDGNPEIYVVNADGTDQRRMTRNSTDDWEPAWSPDGEWLLYVSGQTTDIFAMRADGSETRRLTHDRHANWSPVWRPSTPIAESTFEGVRVTFITNAGFLITVGDKRILVDAIYKGYPGGVLKPILDSQPPFDGVDVILATHEHHDHFDPELVLQYLQDNPKTVFVSNPNAVEAILTLDRGMRTRLTAVELAAGEREQLTIAGIDLEAIHLSHGMPGILNLGFIITIDQVTLFHMGDMDPAVVSVSDLQAYGLPEKQIDIAFVHDYVLTEEEFHAHISEGIQARHLIPMHFGMQPPLGLESVFPNISILQEPYESWALP
jgi:Tol biopolymer transport system component/L-ascorbate metabolism protein UlaG (beta-lactamase superfamily)